MSDSRPILVTGASGFTGSYVVKELLSHGLPVRAMIRNPEKAEALRAMGAEVAMADLAEPATLTAAVKGCGAVIHIAALFRQAGLPEAEFIRINIEGTKALLDASEQFGVRRFIHCSTVGVHGHVSTPPANEDYPFSPGDMYQRSKVKAEELVLSYLSSNRLRGVVIRPAMIYGPGDQRTLKLFRMIARGTFFYVGRGEALVHFIDVRDLARAFYLALIKEELHNRVYIIAGRETMTLRQAAERIATVLNCKPPSLCLPVVPMQLLGSLCELVCTPLGINPPLYRRRVDFFTKHRSFDCSRAQAELGFEPAQDSLGEITDIVNSYLLSGDIKLPHQSRSYPGQVGASQTRVS